jgi:hypothetical protein
VETNIVKLSATGSETLALMREVVEGIAEAPPQLRNAVTEAFQSFSECFSIERNCVLTPVTSEVRVEFKPTQRLLDLVAAVRAWKQERLIGEVTGKIAIS